MLSRHGRACLDFEVAWSNAAGVNWNLPTNLLLGSSMVEHSAVNRRVVGSSPTRGANTKFRISNTALENAPLTALGSECVHQCEFTHPYPNFLILYMRGTPSFPPATCSRYVAKLYRPVAGLTSEENILHKARSAVRSLSDRFDRPAQSAPSGRILQDHLMEGRYAHRSPAHYDLADRQVRPTSGTPGRTTPPWIACARPFVSSVLRSPAWFGATAKLSMAILG